jgi:hypothetical protein
MKRIFTALTAATVISATVLAMADTANAQWGYRAGFNRGFGYRGLGGGLGYRNGYGVGRGYAGYGGGYAGYGGGYAGYGGGYAGYGNSGYAGYGGGYAGYGGYGCGACGTAIVVPIVVVPTVGCGCSRGFFSGF